MRQLVLLAVLVSAGCVRPGSKFACTDDNQCLFEGRAGSCESVGFCSFPDTTCTDTGRRYGEWSGPYADKCVGFVPDGDDAGIDVDASADGSSASLCPIPSPALHAWTLDIPIMAEYNVQTDVPYTLDDRVSLASTAFTRVAYCLQRDNTFMYVELDDFTGGMVTDTGIPTDKIFDQPVTNMTVRTNAPNVTEVTLGAGGLMELWPNCYTAGNGASAVYDYDDVIAAQTDCYGSFQFHYDTTTLLAYNKWSEANATADDVGIGNQPAGNPDWTFAANTTSFTVRKLQAYILP